MPFISSVSGNFGPTGRSRKPFNLATGGNSTVDVANYNGTGQLWRVHTFTGNGTLTVVNGLDPFRVLCVGGGQGGQNSPSANTGSGGAGGKVFDTTEYLSSGNVSVVIGAGGSNSLNLGGATTVGAVSSSSGVNGGAGAGGVGVGYDGPGAAGGTGPTSNITGSTVYYSGGGGSGATGEADSAPSQSGGAGGNRGGGAGGYADLPPYGPGAGGSGTANTGGGGGGGARTGGPPGVYTTAGGSGGSGIAIIAYRIG